MADTKNGFEAVTAKPKVVGTIRKDAGPMIEPENESDSTASEDVQGQNLSKGAVAFFEGYSDKVTPELIEEAVSKLDAEVAFIDYTKDDKNGYIGLTKEDSAKALVDQSDDDQLKIGDTGEASVRLIEGEEEDEYLGKQVQRRGGWWKRFQSRERPGSQGADDTPAEKK